MLGNYYLTKVILTTAAFLMSTILFSNTPMCVDADADADANSDSDTDADADADAKQVSR